MSISIFVQTNGESDSSVRYFSVGYLNNGKFSGLVYGYEGGGEYSYAYAYLGKYLSEDDTDGGCMEFDEREEVLISLMGSDLMNEINSMYSELFTYDESEGVLCLNEFIPGKEVYTVNFDASPLSYRNTYWKDSPENYWEPV